MNTSNRITDRNRTFDYINDSSESANWPDRPKQRTEIERQAVLEHLLCVLGNKNISINDLIDQSTGDDTDLYGDSRYRIFSSTNSGILSFMTKSSSDFLDSTPIGKSSSKDFVQLFNHIKTAARRIFIGEGSYPTEQQKLARIEFDNSRYQEEFTQDSLVHPLNMAQKLISIRTNYFQSSSVLRLFLLITGCMATAGRVFHRPIIMKSSVALMAVTSLFMIAHYYRFSTNEEKAKFSLKFELQIATKAESTLTSYQQHTRF